MWNTLYILDQEENAQDDYDEIWTQDSSQQVTVDAEVDSSFTADREGLLHEESLEATNRKHKTNTSRHFLQMLCKTTFTKRQIIKTYSSML